MSFSPELILSVVIQLIAIGIFIGVFKTTISFMQVQISKIEQAMSIDKKEIKDTLKIDKQELKDEMRKYNNMLERMIIVEQSTKAAHHREDELSIRITKLEQK